jgi:hypothetical protein
VAGGSDSLLWGSLVGAVCQIEWVFSLVVDVVPLVRGVCSVCVILLGCVCVRSLQTVLCRGLGISSVFIASLQSEGVLEVDLCRFWWSVVTCTDCQGLMGHCCGGGLLLLCGFAWSTGVLEVAIVGNGDLVGLIRCCAMYDSVICAVCCNCRCLALVCAAVALFSFRFYWYVCDLVRVACCVGVVMVSI